MSNATTTERHPIPPIVCTPGCEYGDGRPDALFRGEQTWWGPRSCVDLSLEEVNHDSGLYMPRIVMAYREQQTQAPSVYVHLDGIETHLRGRRDTLDESMHLIAEEAITLAAALVNAAANIAGNQTEPPSV